MSGLVSHFSDLENGCGRVDVERKTLLGKSASFHRCKIRRRPPAGSENEREIEDQTEQMLRETHGPSCVALIVLPARYRCGVA